MSEDNLTKAGFGNLNPLGRHGTSEEMAKLVAFVISDDNAFMTGTTLTTDGGYSLSPKDNSSILARKN